MLFVGVIIYKQIWVLFIVFPVSFYTYYRRLQAIPKDERLKAVLPTIISIFMLIILTVYFIYFR